MTTVQVQVDAGGTVLVDLRIDLGRAAGGPREYYRLSRIARPADDPEVRALLDRLAAAVSLRMDGQAIALELAAVDLPADSEDVFLNPLSWPMSHVVLRGSLPATPPGGAGRLQAAFEPAFRFEEPIALTFLAESEKRRMTRWLVASQLSPPFELGGGAGRSPAPASSTGASLRQFVRFGFQHILPQGLDHVLFVLGLYLGARSLRSLLILVTCFTLAHSLTLGLAALGLVRLPAAIVEPLISASIVWVGVENAIAGSRSDRYRPYLVFGFGLLHGLGFASALSTLEAPRGGFLLTLLSFNAGIELGQLAVIAGALAVTVWYRQREWYRRAVVVPASLLIATIAGAWTVQRMLH